MKPAKQSSFSDQCIEFRETSDRICAIAARYDVKITGYRTPELPLYRQLPFAMQEKSLRSLKVFLTTMESAESSGGNLSKDNCFAWSALSTFGLVPSSDLFAHLRADRAIEIYNLEGQQIWRNLQCMEYCSYTLEEVHCIELFDRYDRGDQKTAECVKMVSDLLTGQTPELYWPKKEPYVMKETRPHDRLILNVQHELMCALRTRDGVVSAWLVMSAAKILGTLRLADLPPLTVVTGQPAAHA